MNYFDRQNAIYFVPSIVRRLAKFLIAVFAMTIVCTVIWQEFVTDVLYNCTDGIWLDFLFPGNWVHFYHGVIYVPHIVVGRSMSEPDAIRTGWNMARLWILWWTFVGVSLFISWMLGRVKWVIFNKINDPELIL